MNCAIIVTWETMEPKGGFTLLVFGGTSLQMKEGGDAMITYSDFFQFCILIIAIVNLVYQICKDKKK